MLIQLKKKLYLPLIALMTVAFFLSCQKDNINNDPNPTPETPDLSSKVNASVSGFVTDENNAPVQGADVRAGSAAPVTTDEYGYFEIKNTDVVQTAAVVTVSKAGYFKGIKTWGAAAGKSAFFRIKLIPKTTAGTINATSGGNVTLTNGLIIALPSNGVVKASDNSSYNGNINVAVSWLDPEASDLTQIMPGDLRGIDEDGSMKGLTTFGMAAVELTNDAGEMLQIASGKKATITMPLSTVLSSAAPSSIPLWYFDESNGLWKEDGSATKSGNSYVGEVSHFSWWNCYLPNATVPLTFTVVDNAGNPIANAHVEITQTSTSSWAHAGGYTDATGIVSIFVTANTSYLLEIFSNCNYYGGTPNYSQNFSVVTSAVNLGNVVVGTASTATVSGTITNCAASPVTNGYIIMQNGYYYSRYPVDNTGAYSFNTVLCNGSTPVTLIGEDISAAQQSTPITYTLVVGLNTVPNIAACGINTTQFINYSINGGAIIGFTAPGDSIVHTGNGTTSPSYIIGNYPNSTPTNNYVNFGYDNAGIGVGTSQNLIAFNSSAILDQTTIPTPIGVIITEYGAVGDYIAGQFTGTIIGSAPANTPYVINCNFRVRRNF